VRLGVKPEINAICTLMIAVVGLGVLAAAALNRRRELQRADAVDLTAKL